MPGFIRHRLQNNVYLQPIVFINIKRYDKKEAYELIATQETIKDVCGGFVAAARHLLRMSEGADIHG